MSHPAYEEILEYWFGSSTPQPQDMEERGKLWFGADAAVDETIKTRFGALVRDAKAGGFPQWESAARSRLALIILLDQFTRNVYRGRVDAFAGDARALRLTLEGVDVGMDRELSVVDRLFFYIPLEHSEDIRMQERCVAAHEALHEECATQFKPFVANSLRYAREHRDVIASFGRFPHRNKTLGRAPTQEEAAYLSGGGSTYGQGSES